MSSNIEIQKICEYCGNVFTAKTTVTRLCSPKCRKANYKKKQRDEKINNSIDEAKKIKNKTIVDIKEKEVLNVREVSILLGCSIRTVYRLIDNNTITGINLGERMTRVKRSDINVMLEKPKQTIEPIKKIDECYTIKQIIEKYKISEKAVSNIIKRNNIPKLKKGWYTYVPKNLIDEIFS